MKYYSAVLLSALISCSSPSSSRDNIKIFIDVREWPAIGLSVSTLDDAPQLVHFDPNKHGEYIIHNQEAAYITLHNGFSERKTLYAEKGDRIHLSFDGKSMKETAAISGDHPAITEYLSNYTTIPFQPDIYTLPFPEFKAALARHTAENYKLLDSFQNIWGKAGRKFVKLERARIKYLFAPALLNYPRVHGWEEPGGDYYATIEAWIEEDKDYLNLGTYRKFISAASRVLVSREKEEASTEYGKVLEQMYYADRYFKQEGVKQGFISIWANEYIQRNGINQIDELDQFTRKKLRDKKLLSLYEEIYDSWARITPGNKAIDFIAQDTTGKEFSLKDFRNRYTCLYLWQNVGPCLAEFSHLKQLAPLFSAKNIQLINLSIEPKAEQWKEAVSNPVIQTGQHLFLKNKKPFLEAYHNNPTSMYQFILIDPEGKIVNPHLPGASSGQLEKYLTERLKKAL